MTSLTNLEKTKVYRSAKRRGRGYGSGRGGHTTGTGQKGQGTRAGRKLPVWFEGGQNPLVRRLPQQKGFKSTRLSPEVINLSQIAERYAAGETVSPQTLLDKGLLARLPQAGVKILGRGELQLALHFRGVALSGSARDKATQAGGKILSS